MLRVDYGVDDRAYCGTGRWGAVVGLGGSHILEV